MWKYKCKSQFFILLGSFVVGVLLTVIMFSTTSSVMLSEILPEEMLGFIKNNFVLTCVSGGLGIAGIVNVVLISQLLMPLNQWVPIMIFMLLFIAPSYVFMISTMLVVPMMIVDLYGWLSLRSNTSRQVKMSKISDDKEFVRVYQIHHKLLPEYEGLAKECRKNVTTASLVYSLGVVAIFCVLLFIENIILLVFLLLFFMIAFNALLRFRSQQFIPITRLLYEQCDPEACASAIIYYSTRRSGKVRLTQRALLAQCLIYMNDPDLAQDILITFPKKDPASTLTYWSLMGYIDYMLKDEDALDRAYEEASKVRMNFGPTGVMIRSNELAGIKNKINLMNGDFNTCKQYYLQEVKSKPFPFQQVDACYYIALISFVEEEYKVAQMYFQKVVDHGNKMYFVQNAKTYLDKIDSMDLSDEDL